MRTFTLIVGVLSVVAAGSWSLGCADGKKEAARLAATPIRIGAVYDLSSLMAGDGQASVRGMQLAVEQINAAGGVLGRKIELVVKDGAGDEAKTAAAVRELIKTDNVVAIAGFNDTDGALAGGPVAQQARIPFLTAGATLPLLPTQVGDYCFTACYNDFNQGFVLGTAAGGVLKAKSAFVLVDGDREYARTLADYFRDRYMQFYGEPVIRKVSLAKTDVAKLIEEVKALPQQPEVLFFACMPEYVGPLVKQFRAAGFTQPILGGDSFDTVDLLKDAGAAANEVYYTTHIAYDNPDPAIQAFVRAYTAKFGQAPTTAFAALGYDSINLLADAIRRAESDKPTAIRNALAQVRDFPAITGKITFVLGDRAPRKPVTVIGVKDGQPKFLRLIDPQTGMAPSRNY